MDGIRGTVEKDACSVLQIGILAGENVFWWEVEETSGIDQWRTSIQARCPRNGCRLGLHQDGLASQNEIGWQKSSSSARCQPILGAAFAFLSSGYARLVSSSHSNPSAGAFFVVTPMAGFAFFLAIFR